jgi:hypothetical protein
MASGGTIRWLVTAVRILKTNLGRSIVQWFMTALRRLALDLLFLLLGAVLLYWIAVGFGWISPDRSADAEAYRAIQTYAATGAQVQWESVDLHGLGSDSLVVVVRPSLPLPERLDMDPKVSPSLIVLDKRSPSFFDRLAQRQPGFYEAYKVTLSEPSDSLFGWDADLRIVEAGQGEPPVVIVEWSTPIADDTLWAVTLTTWDGRYSTTYLPSPAALLQVAEPFPHMGHPEFVTSDGTHVEGWYLNHNSAYAFLELDGDPTTELAAMEALEFVEGYTYEGECRACAHRYVVAVWDVRSTDGMTFSPNVEWPAFPDRTHDSQGVYTPSAVAVTDIVDRDVGAYDFLLSEVHRRSSPWWLKP